MKPYIVLASCILAALVAPTAGATSPEQDLAALRAHYRETLPKIAPEDYIYGALAMSADARAQYEEIMSFPPFQDALERGRALWERPFHNGRYFADCYANGGQNVAGNYPMFDESHGKVVTFEMSLNACLRENAEPELRLDDMATMGVLSAHARSLSDGMKVDIRVQGPGALAAYEAGKKMFYGRRGQFDFACSMCHVDNAGRHLRNEFLSTAIGQATHWPVFRSPGDDLWTLQRRYVGCYKLIRATPLEIGSEDYNNLEYFHTFLSNGLPMKASVFRK